MMKTLPKTFTVCLALYVLLFVNSSYGIVIITCPEGQYPELNIDNFASQYFYCKACPAKTKPDPSGAYCLICKQDGSGNCIPDEYCNPGELWTSGACKKVVKGKFTVDGRTGWLCPPGMYGDEEGASMCKLCPAGQYADAMQLQACKNCPAGTFVATTGSEKQADCSNCDSGKYSAPGSPQCLACTNGVVSANKDACEICPKGTYYNSGACSACASGTYSSTAGSAECSPCNGVVNVERDTCDLCPAGTYSNSGECSACASGTYSSTAGSTECADCSNGVVSANRDACSPKEEEPKETEITEESSGSNLGIILGCVFGAIGVVIVILAIYFYGASFKKFMLNRRGSPVESDNEKKTAVSAKTQIQVAVSNA